jgi:DNA-binding phage protein
MDEATQIATEQIANYLKALMKEKNINAQNLIDSGINTQQVYSVLRMGKTARPDYRISTFIKVLSVIGVHLEFHDLSERSNLDLNHPNHKN